MSNPLVEDNIKLVYHIISREYPTYIKDEDIIQCGMVGLCKAAKYWKEQGLFSTYAGKCIRQEICLEFIRRKKHSKVVSLDANIGEEDTLGDIIVGKEDVDFIDDTLYQNFTKDELAILELYKEGYAAGEIAKMREMKVNKVRKILRTIKLKWRNFYG
jgi:RNA polymerase sigma factor (sigma-70 family)